MEATELRSPAPTSWTTPRDLRPAHAPARGAGGELARPADGVGRVRGGAREARHLRHMYEGNAPHRPRYVLPDYATLLEHGSAYLELDPPRDLDEALNTLLIAYTQVPSITGYPVWLGDLDALLGPYVGDLDDDGLRRRLRLFWIALDRMLPDAFTHANLGPDDLPLSPTAFSLERELLQVVPNLTLKVDPLRTPDSLVETRSRPCSPAASRTSSTTR